MKTPCPFNLRLNFEACGGADGKNREKLCSGGDRKLMSSFHTACLTNAHELFAFSSRLGCHQIDLESVYCSIR